MGSLMRNDGGRCHASAFKYKWFISLTGRRLPCLSIKSNWVAQITYKTHSLCWRCASTENRGSYCLMPCTHCTPPNIFCWGYGKERNVKFDPFPHRGFWYRIYGVKLRLRLQLGQDVVLTRATTRTLSPCVAWLHKGGDLDCENHEYSGWIDMKTTTTYKRLFKHQRKWRKYQRSHTWI